MKHRMQRALTWSAVTVALVAMECPEPLQIARRAGRAQA